MAWYFAFLLGIGMIKAIGSLCPAEEMVSGVCIAWWATYAERGAYIFCAGLAAFLVVVSAAIIAPSHRVIVARVSFGLGFIVAAFMALPLGAVLEFVAATVAGLYGLRFVSRLRPHKILPDKALEGTQ